MISDYAPNLLDNFEGIDNFYPCDYYKNKYLKIFEENMDSCDIVNLVHRKLQWGKCDLNTQDYAEVVKLHNTTCYVAPPAPGPLRQAFNYYTEGKFRDAIRSFEEFVNKTDDADKKAKYLYMIAKIYYRDLKNFPMARKYALKAVKFKSNWGEPYLLIGKLYASSGPICGPGRGWDSQIVTWPAIDKFKYAKKIDPSVSKEANKLINAYEKFMPSVEDIFQRTLKIGDTFKVGCWINETTKIRAAKK
jgi:tetratricopeptide (TPR) repeat protein